MTTAPAISPGTASGLSERRPTVAAMARTRSPFEGPRRAPPAYSSVPAAALRESARRLAALDLGRFVARFRETLWPAFARDHAIITPDPALAVRRSGLLGVPGACLWIALGGLEFGYRVGPLNGLATLFPGDDGGADDIPVFLTFGAVGRTTIRHEKIHLCQMLHPDPWPLSAGEREFFRRWPFPPPEAGRGADDDGPAADGGGTDVGVDDDDSAVLGINEEGERGSCRVNRCRTRLRPAPAERRVFRHYARRRPGVP